MQAVLSRSNKDSQGQRGSLDQRGLLAVQVKLGHREAQEVKGHKDRRVEAGVCGGSTKTVEVIVVGEVGGGDKARARLLHQEIEGLQTNLVGEEAVAQALVQRQFLKLS